MKILVVGDSYMPAAVFERAFARLAEQHPVTCLQLDEDRRPPASADVRGLREYVGDPAQVQSALRDHQILAFHVAPVTKSVLDAAPFLSLIGCARGGPVNVDVAAASRRGIPVVITPGKNAEAVADLTLGFMLMLARGIPRAQGFILGGGKLGGSVVEGAQFFGRDLGGQILGLVGFGQVGRKVAARARAFGMATLVFDPFVPAAVVAESGAESVDLAVLLARSDVVSVHARGTADNQNMFDARVFRAMKPGALFVNTARESLVDEEALLGALRERRLGGAALDVIKVRGNGERSPLLDVENVIVTPHIAGATLDTVRRGAEMLADEIGRFVGGVPLVNLANPEVQAGPRVLSS